MPGGRRADGLLIDGTQFSNLSYKGIYAETRADEANFLAGKLPFVVTTERVTFRLA